MINAMIGARPDAAGAKYAEADRYPYYYPPYYWYAGYNPYYPYDPYWYYPSMYFGFNYYRPVYMHRYAFPHQTYYRNYGYRPSGRIGGGRHR